MLQHLTQINTGAGPLSAATTSAERTAAAAEWAARRKYPATGQIAMLDLSTEPPTRVMMEYAHGAEAFERDPARWKPEALDDAEHRAEVEAVSQTRTGHQRRTTP